MKINMWQVNLFAALMVVLVVLLRSAAADKLPAKTWMICWKVIWIRLLFPFTITVSILPAWFGIRAYRSAPQVSAAAGSSKLASLVNHLPAAAGQTDVIDRGSFLHMIWIAGSIIGILYFLISYRKAMREFRTSLPSQKPEIQSWMESKYSSTRKHQGALARKIEVRYSDLVRSPLTYGIFHPVILIPKAIEFQSDADLSYVLTHEYIHIRRHDCLQKLLLALSICLYWYNPFVWILYLLANRDIELSCDEEVIRVLGKENRANYALLLLEMEEQRGRNGSALLSNFSKNATEERIRMLMNIKKKSIAGAAAVVLLLALTTTAFAMESDKNQDTVTKVHVYPDGEEDTIETSEIDEDSVDIDEDTVIGASANEDDTFEESDIVLQELDVELEENVQDFPAPEEHLGEVKNVYLDINEVTANAMNYEEFKAWVESLPAQKAEKYHSLLEEWDKDMEQIYVCESEDGVIVSVGIVANED